MNIYRRAWELLKERIGTKTGWGKNELATAMSECLERAIAEHNDNGDSK